MEILVDGGRDGREIQVVEFVGEKWRVRGRVGDKID